MKLLCLFAGQGYQDDNLFDFFQNQQAAQDLLKEFALKLEENTTTLSSPAQAQLLIGAYHFTLFKQIEPLLRAHQVTLAGYSLGEVSAFLVSAQASPQQVQNCLAFRTQLMSSLITPANSYEYDLLALRGRFNLAQVEEVAKQLHCALAIINSEEQVIIGGRVSDLAQIPQQLPTLSHSQFLNIHLPSHTPFYADKKGCFYDFLNKNFSKALLYPILSPLELTRVYDRDQASQLLDRELYSCLQWQKLCMLITDYQYDLIIDLGPGDALSKQLENLNLDLPLLSLSNYKNLAGVLSRLQQTQNNPLSK